LDKKTDFFKDCLGDFDSLPFEVFEPKANKCLRLYKIYERCLNKNIRKSGLE
jgi:hypothetical protein